MFVAKKSAAQKIITAIIVRKGFFFPTKTAARAIHPRPLEIFGTKQHILIASSEPEIAAKKLEISQERILVKAGEIPFARRTSLSLPVILMYNPVFVKLKNKTASVRRIIEIDIVNILVLAILKLNNSEERTPRVL